MDLHLWRRQFQDREAVATETLRINLSRFAEGACAWPASQLRKTLSGMRMASKSTPKNSPPPRTLVERIFLDTHADGMGAW